MVKKPVVDLNLMFDELISTIRPLIDPELMTEHMRLEKLSEEDIWDNITEALHETFESQLKRENAYELANMLMVGIRERNKKRELIEEVRAEGPSMASFMKLMKLLRNED